MVVSHMALGTKCQWCSSSHALASTAVLGDAEVQQSSGSIADKGLEEVSGNHKYPKITIYPEITAKMDTGLLGLSSWSRAGPMCSGMSQPDPLLQFLALAAAAKLAFWGP